MPRPAVRNGKRTVAWEEVAQAELLAVTIVQHWKHGELAAPAVEQGAKVIMSPAVARVPRHEVRRVDGARPRVGGTRGRARRLRVGSLPPPRRPRGGGQIPWPRA